MNKEQLNAADIRKTTIKLSCDSGAGHLASSLSTVEMLTVLFRSYLKYDVNDTKSDMRDRLIFSKGHGAYAYYVILNKIGILPDHEITDYYNGGSLSGCLVQNNDYMLEASTGSLGHGLPIAVGMAKAFKIQNKQNKVVCIVGDGEMQEGSNFESLAFAYKHKLDNLLVIVDANNFQAMDEVKDVSLDNNMLSKVLNVYADNHFFDIDGHNESLLNEVYNNFFYDNNKNMSICVCRTIKGKGLPLIENKAKYHFRCPTEDGYVYDE